MIRTAALDLASRLGRQLGVLPAESIVYVQRFAEVLDVPLGSPFTTNPSWSNTIPGTRRFHWGPARRRNGSPHRLTPANLMAHLLGDYSVGVARERCTRLLIIDIDAKTVEDSGTVNVRRWQVEQALNSVPYFVVQSSASGGQHMLYFLDHGYSTAQVHGAIVAALRRAGIEPKRCGLEVFPNGRRALRLPLGAGSLPIDDLECRPLAGLITRRRIVRDPARALMLLLDFAEHTRVPLDQLIGGRRSDGHGYADEQGLINIRGKGQQRPSTGWAKGPSVYTSSDYHRQLADCGQGISAPGRRYAESQLRVWDAVVRRGLSPEDAVADFEAWLWGGDHASKDLTRNPSATIRRMLRDAVRYAAHLRRQVEGGHLRTGVPRPAAEPQFGSLKIYLGKAKDRAGGEWRALVRSRLTAGDRAALDNANDAWLQNRLAILIGVVRFGHEIDGAQEFITIAASAMQSIAGGKAPPARFCRRKRIDPRAGNPSAYAVVLKEAERLGIIEYQTAAVIGARARMYRLQLPATIASAATLEMSFGRALDRSMRAASRNPMSEHGDTLQSPTEMTNVSDERSPATT